jgi:CubicO group peptidase (beta-lactamase class C family)
MQRPLRNLLLTALALATVHATPAASHPARQVYPDARWKYVAAPEKNGWSSAKLELAERFARRIGSAAVMVVEGGLVVAALGPVDHRYPLHSIRKPLMSAMVGIYAARGLIDIHKTLGALGIDDVAPALSAIEKQATLADLISSRSGVYHPALAESAGMARSRPARGSHRPGSFWYYNNWDFNAVGTIFEQAAGQSFYAAFAEEIATPLRMQDFTARDGTYVSGPESMHRAYAMRMSARDLARFGLLYLRKGRWRDKQVVPSDWVERSTATHSDIGRGRGYGYMWRTAVDGGLAPNVNLPVRCFGHSGLGVHFLVVIPAWRLVLVHRVDTYAPAPYPRPTQIGRLIWMILDARGIKDIGEDPALAAQATRRLRGPQLKKALLAHRFEVTVPNGLVEGGDRVYTLGFAADGTLTLTGGHRPSIYGQWNIHEDRCCVDIDGLKTCLAVVARDDGIGFYDATDTLYRVVRKIE